MTEVNLNSMLATMEAQRGGYDEAILLTEEGTIADSAVVGDRDGRWSAWLDPV